MDKIFGQNFVPSKKNNDCVIGFFIRKKIVNDFSGTVKDEKSTVVTKSMLWTYFYYLWLNNKEVFPFFEIKNKSQFMKGSKHLLTEYLKTKYYTQSKSYFNKEGSLQTITKFYIMKFINDMINGSELGSLNIPFLKSKQNGTMSIEDYLDDKLNRQNVEYDNLLDNINKKITSPKINQLKIVGESDLVKLTEPSLKQTSTAKP